MIIAFDYQVSLGQSLSSRGVAYLTGPVGSVIAFQTVPVNLTGLLVNLTANGSTLAVDRAYNNTVFAVVSSDRLSNIFTCATATSTQTVTYNNSDSVTPEVRRLASLGYL
jgi:hypothetical protein